MWDNITSPDTSQELWSGTFNNLCEGEARAVANDYAEILKEYGDFEQVFKDAMTPEVSLHLKPVLQWIINTMTPLLENPMHKANLATHQMAGMTFINTMRMLESVAPRTAVLTPDGSSRWNAPDMPQHRNIWWPEGVDRVPSRAECIQMQKDEKARVRKGEKKEHKRGGKKAKPSKST